MRYLGDAVRVAGWFLVICLPASTVLAQVVIPDMGDMNCDGNSNVVDA